METNVYDLVILIESKEIILVSKSEEGRSEESDDIVLGRAIPRDGELETTGDNESRSGENWGGVE